MRSLIDPGLDGERLQPDRFCLGYSPMNLGVYGLDFQFE